MCELAVERRLEELTSRGVIIPDRRQVFVEESVVLGRIAAGVVLHPGTRLAGAGLWLGPGAQVGTEGPATLVNAVFDEGTSIASGYVEGAVLLRGASLGHSAHVRPGTLLEEGSSTAHAVGLKQTILLAYVTLGSLINFCDCLMAGGTSRRDHSEVGSGYIHFNYTPWGAQGDKATPSLVGDVVHGVFLRSRRIFLGGSGGLVGPAEVGYGAIAAAGQVLRESVPANHLYITIPKERRRPFRPGMLDATSPRKERNLRYLGELVALREWYRQVRLPAAGAARRPVMDAVLALLDGAIAERSKRLTEFLSERGHAGASWEPPLTLPERPLALAAAGDDHLKWVTALTEDAVAQGEQWLATIVAAASRLPGAPPSADTVSDS